MTTDGILWQTGFKFREIMHIANSSANYYKIVRNSKRISIPRDNAVAEKEAEKILAVCRHFSFRELEKLTCFYLGVKNNRLIEVIAQSFGQVYALDVVQPSPTPDWEFDAQGNINYVDYENGFFDIKDLSIDVVICDRLCGAVDNPEEFMFEIYRVLNYEGFCYFSAYNGLSLIGKNRGFPFLTWIFHRFAESITKISGYKYNCGTKTLTLSRLKRLTDNFWRHDYVGLIRRNPLSFCYADNINSGSNSEKYSGSWLKYLYPFLPLWVWILTKKK
jgi:SAM-dependent methyltransferase